MIISRAGDWMSKTIENPPSEVWVRGIPTRGMMSVASLFRKILFVATGSGIAPIAPWIFSIKGSFPTALDFSRYSSNFWGYSG